MHLIDVVRQGKPLPVKLPPDLIPPSYRKTVGGAAGAKMAPSHAVGLPPGGLGGIGSATALAGKFF